ncbi:hypothetical protein IAT40_006151 [Kwoniella sp. CBS 6097]
MRLRILTVFISLAWFFDLSQAESPSSAPVGQGNDSLTARSPVSNLSKAAPEGVTHADAWKTLRKAVQCSVDDVDNHQEVATDPKKPDASLTTETTVVFTEPTQPVDTFVSFEEWKKMKEVEEEDERSGDAHREDNEADGQTEQPDSTKESETTLEAVRAWNGVSSNHSAKGDSTEPKTLKSHVPQSDVRSESSVSTSQISSQQPSASPPPHHNRYNYASPDCSARIHSSSPQTQHASSLLHKSRDRYMLTPCKAKEHWVVVELCDEIRIEAVEVAVWEFFSGVVREVRVSVGGEDDEEYEDDPDDGVNGRSPKWKEVGSFIGKNIRGVQTFKLPQPTSFHRFIRLDFPSYFGTEYYCPVSQLKVYGMNQMEAFKWEQKRISAAAKEKEKEKEKNGNNRDKEAEERKTREERERKEQKDKDEKAKQELREKELDELEKLLHEQAGRVVPDILTETAILSKLQQTTSTPSASSKVPKTSKSSVSTTSASTRKDPSSASAQVSSRQINASATSVETKQVRTGTNATSQSSNTALSQASSSSSSSFATSQSPSSSSSKTITETPISTSTYSRSPPPRSDSSESIYAFIIRRLNALEGNSTLVARYIEEQAKVMRHMLTRVERGWEDWKGDWEGEDRGRWEQERMRQEDRLGRVISQLEQQKIAMEAERKEIQTQLRVLADELGYERRRGLAQLFIIFVIIVLGVITRSSTIDAVLKPLLAEAKRRRSMRKSFSGPLTGLRIDMGLGRPPAVIGQGRPRHEPVTERGDQAALRHTEHRANSRTGRQDMVISDGDDVRVSSPVSPTPTSTHRSRHGHGHTHSHTGNRNSISRRPGTPNSIRQRRLPPGVITSNFRSVSATDTTTLTGAAAPFSPSSALPTSAVSGGGSVFLHSGLTSPAFNPNSNPKSRNSLNINTPRVNGLAGPSRRLARSAHLHTMEADKLRHELKGKSRAHSVTEPGAGAGAASGTALDGAVTDTTASINESNINAVDQTPRKSGTHPTTHDHRQAAYYHSPTAQLGPGTGSGSMGDQVSPFTIQLNDGRMPEPLPLEQGDRTRDGDRDRDGEEVGDDDTDGPSDWGTDVETEGSVSEVENELHTNGKGGGLKSSQEAVMDEFKSIWNGTGHGTDTNTTADEGVNTLRNEGIVGTVIVCKKGSNQS